MREQGDGNGNENTSESVDTGLIIDEDLEAVRN